jgi:dipeptidyl aminopeptidase/acylaminoacyl peptidase
VIWAGVVGSYADMIERWHRNGVQPTPTPGARRWRNEWIAQFGSPEQNPDFWNSLSATSYLADLSGPVQLHHGTADEEVPLAFSEDLARGIQAAGKTADLYTYPGDNHNISQSFSLAMQRTIQFFNTYLK